MDGVDRSCCLGEEGTIRAIVLGMRMNTVVYPRLVRSTGLGEGGVGRRKEQGERGAGEPGRTAAAQAAMEDMWMRRVLTTGLLNG